MCQAALFAHPRQRLTLAYNLKNLELRIPRGKLVVITGPSGSGKSSLAFDTIYAEGYRKYIESLSVSARQMLEQLKRPDVDFIHGLSPVLAIEQREGGAPRAAPSPPPRKLPTTLPGCSGRCRAEQRCPKDGGRIVQRSRSDDNVQRIICRKCAGERIMLLAPALRAKPSVLRDELPRLRQRGFQRVRIAGEIKNLDDPQLVPGGAGTREIEVDLVVDRMVASADQRSRLADSLELAFREGRDRASRARAESTETRRTREAAAPASRWPHARFAAMFSRNSPRGIFPSTTAPARARPAAGWDANCASCRNSWCPIRKNRCAKARSSRGASEEKISSQINAVLRQLAR